MKRIPAAILALTIFCALYAAPAAAGPAGSDLLLVIDMQNAYTQDGPWACPRIGTAAENIIRLLEDGSFGQILFTRFDAPQDPAGTWRDYNSAYREINESGFLNDIIPPLRAYAERYPMYSKSVYSSAAVPEIRAAMEDCIARGGSVVLTGVTSECCVLATALQAIDMGCPVIYLADACAGCSGELEEAVRRILEGVHLQAAILDTDAYLEGQLPE